jgi:succinate dehydrogenase / fumarate reductase, cytochrome b subunit
MSWVSTYFRSAIGAKQIMAITGLGLVLFSLLHMVGHLLMFQGSDAYNAYAAQLQSLGALKWIARGGLLVMVTLHIAAALRTLALSRAARPTPYARYEPRRSTIASRSMRLTGMVLFVFIAFHLAHFTFGAVQPEHYGHLDQAQRHDAYRMFVAGFQNVGLFAVYLVAPGARRQQLAANPRHAPSQIRRRHRQAGPKHRRDFIHRLHGAAARRAHRPPQVICQAPGETL